MTDTAGLRALAETAGRVGGDWYVVEPVYLPRDTEPYVIARSPDPHIGEMVCDFADASMAGVEDQYDDAEWTARNWALAEYIAACGPTTIIALIDRAEKAERELAEAKAQARTLVDAATQAFAAYEECISDDGDWLGLRAGFPRAMTELSITAEALRSPSPSSGQEPTNV